MFQVSKLELQTLNHLSSDVSSHPEDKKL